MYPTLKNNEFVITAKRIPIHRNEVIVFNAYGVDKKTQMFIKIQSTLKE